MSQPMVLLRKDALMFSLRQLLQRNAREGRLRAPPARRMLAPHPFDTVVMMPGRHGGSAGGSEGVDALSIRIDGHALTAALQVVDATVVRDVGALPEARVVLGSSVDTTSLPDEGQAFPPGAAIEIDVLRDGEVLPLFRGVLTGKAVAIQDGSTQRLTLACRHALYVATLAPKFRLWRDVSDADCIAQLLAGYEQTVVGRLSGTVHPVLLQHATSDWAFALARAEANGWWLLATDDGVELRNPDEVKAAAFQLEVGISIHAFEGRWDVCDQPAGLQAMAWAPAYQSVEVAEAAEPVALPGRMPGSMLAAVHGQSMEIRHAGDIAPSSLHGMASALLHARRRASPSGRVTCTGTPLAMPGAWMELRGVGQGFDGEMPISGVTHAFTASGWVTEVRFGAHADASATAGSPAAHAGVHGLQIGIVESIEDDPDGEGRVRVRLPLLGNDGVGVHARLALPDAGNNRGMMFFPEIGDEVVVACFDGDPARAVVLGSLYSGVRPPPLALADDKPIKGYVSQSGMKLLFDDAAGALRIEDAHGNRIVMDASGVAIESTRDLSLKAKGNVGMQGMNMKLHAPAQLELFGDAGAKLESRGIVSVRGSLLKLN